MSILAMEAVFCRRDLDPYERLVMLALADHVDAGGSCYPSIARLCDRTGMKERGVQTVIRRLAARGVIEVEEGGGRRMSNRYTLINPAPDAPINDDKPRTENPVSHYETPHLTTETPHPMSETPHLTTLNPAPDAPEPLGTKNNQEEPLESARRRARRRPELPLPEDWTPSDRNIADAKSRGFSQQEIENETDGFRNHHLAKGSLFRDWDAAWRTWLGNARRYGRRPMVSGKVSGGGGPGGSLASIAAWRRSTGQV